MAIDNDLELQNSIQELEKRMIGKPKIPTNFDYLSSLNEMQKVAATRLEGNFLVVAGPGAGKTHTILYRVLHMIKMGISAKEICIITFTRKAANQLKKRIQYLLPEIELGYIGTIHGLAFMIIKRLVGKNLRLIDPEDDKLILRLAIEEYQLQLPFKTQLKTVHKIIDYSQTTLKSIQESLIDLNREDISETDILTIQKAYENYKKKFGYMNYTDIIRYIAFGGKGINRGELNYLIIDEYQDTDPTQLLMIKSLKFPNVMAVGDDFQSIYSFRGADNKIILNFYNDFENSKLIKLDVNYRSTKEIVKLENTITDASSYGYRKNLVSGSTVENGVLKIQSNDNGVIDSVIKRILEDKSKTYSFIYRYNKTKKKIEGSLIENNIDYVVYGGIKLLERKHIKDILAIVLTNNNKNDFVSYFRSLTLLEGIGEISAKRLIRGEIKLENRADLIKLTRIIHSQYQSISELLDEAIDFYLELETVLLKSNYEKVEIIEDFQTIKKLSKNYASVNNFISDIIIDSNQDKWSSREKNSRVVLTTIHSAKGLEFDEVNYIYEPSIEYEVEKAEENRRLFYTAISRAKRDLYIYDVWGRDDIFKILNDFEIKETEFSDTLSSNESLENYQERLEQTQPVINYKELIMNEIYNENRNLLQEIRELWPEIILNIRRPEYREMLEIVSLKFCTNNYLFLTYPNHDSRVFLLNWKQIEFEVIPILSAAIGKRMEIIGLSDEEFDEVISTL